MIPTIFAPLIQNGILLLAGWQTFKVLETTRNDDDAHWLTFWFVYTLFAFAKSIADYAPSSFPSTTGLTAAIVYLAWGNGATHIYKTLLKPLLKEHEKFIDDALAQAKAQATGAIGQHKRKWEVGQRQ